MTSLVVVFQSNQRITQLPPCLVDTNYFKKVFEIICEVTNEAANLAISDLQKSPDQSDEDFDKFKEYVKNLYKVQVRIYGTKGEFKVSQSDLIFDESKLPNLSSVVIDNFTHYKITSNHDSPYKVSVQFDFNKPPILDFSTNPSFATDNNSVLEIYSVRETWVNGVHGKIMDSIKEIKTNRSYLHTGNCYDLLLWFIYLPLIFWNLFKLEPLISKLILNISNVLLVFIYIYIVIAVIYIFRILFGYAKWVFPYMEFEGHTKRSSSKHRILFVTLSTGIMVSLLKDFILNIIKSIF